MVGSSVPLEGEAAAVPAWVPSPAVEAGSGVLAGAVPAALPTPAETAPETALAGAPACVTASARFPECPRGHLAP
jgi:hypothetical protein